MISPDDDRELLSAYLAGELPDAAAEGLERRFDAEPGLRARLDTLHDALVALQGLDEVEPPAGFSARLRERLDAEAGGAAAAASERAAGAVVDLDEVRARRRVPWAPLGAVAAGVATLAVVVSVVGPPGAMDTDVALEDGDEDAPAAMAAPEADDMVDAEALPFEPGAAALSERHATTGDSQAAPAPEPPEPVAGPIVLDSEVPLDDEAAVRDRYTGLGEAEGLLGMRRREAGDRAAAARFAVQRSEAFASGVHPAACLDVVSTATDAPVVVARVESAVHEGATALVYVTVTASDGSPELDRVEAWVVSPDTCATRLYLTV